MAMPVIWAGYVDYPGVEWERAEPHNAQAYRNASEAGLLDLAQAIQGLQMRSREIVLSKYFSRLGNSLFPPLRGFFLCYTGG